MHQAVFADIQVARAGAAVPAIRLAGDQVLSDTPPVDVGQLAATMDATNPIELLDPITAPEAMTLAGVGEGDGGGEGSGTGEGGGTGDGNGEGTGPGSGPTTGTARTVRPANAPRIPPAIPPAFAP